MQSILILSHDDAFRNECTEALREEGYDLHPVATEKGMYDFLKKNHGIDLVIVNSPEPGHECRRVLDKLAQQTPHVSVLLSCDSSSFWNDFSTWLADACMVTPVNKAIFKDAVKRLLGRGKRKRGDEPDLAVGLS